MEAVNTDIPANREMVFDFYKKNIKESFEDKNYTKKNQTKNIVLKIVLGRLVLDHLFLAQNYKI